MIQFLFKIGKAFLKYNNHPITIPRTHYNRLVSEIYAGTGRKTIQIHITPFSKNIINGKIYYGIAGYGPFYQIKVLGGCPRDYFGDIKIGNIVQITIERISDKINVLIENDLKISTIIDIKQKI